MKKLIVANWKMNSSFDQSDAWLKVFLEKYEDYFEAMQNVDIVVCPPVFLLDHIDSALLDNTFEKLDIFLEAEKKKIEDYSEEELTELMAAERPFELGAQDCHYEESGSFTGDISASMVHSLNALYVILGHSERRAHHFESNEIVAKKVRAALKNNLVPIICVGESQETRNQAGHLEFVYNQLLSSIPRDVKFPKLVIAYEPIWSIGTGLVPTNAQIKEMMHLIRKVIHEKYSQVAQEVVLLYGGSASDENAKEIMGIDYVDGLLVGKASLDAQKFIKICLS